MKFLLKIRDLLAANYVTSWMVYVVLKFLMGRPVPEGWLRSFRSRQSENAQGDPIPWIVYDAVEVLERNVTSDIRVFEYGSGHSTLWWGKHAREVYSCENDLQWFEYIQSTMPENVTLMHKEVDPGGAYSKAASEVGGLFDVIVVDGRDRVNCFVNSLPYLSERGVMILDNSERDRYQPARDAALEKGFSELCHSGMSPVATILSKTSIFYRPNNCLGLS